MTAAGRRAPPGGPVALAALLLAASIVPGDFLARSGPAAAPAQEPADSLVFSGLRYRLVGPTRGGRAQAVAGHRDRPRTFYTGTTGGGVWKTTDDGESWRNVSDGYVSAGSIGAVDVAGSDPSVVWAATGEADIRGNASAGRGVYRSGDAGRTWEFVGLPEIGQAGDLVVHPRDPDVAWVAALGHAFGPNPERGVYRTTDAGENWERVLFVSDSTGFVDLAMNPENPREIYAAAWRAERKPWTLVDGAEEGGLFKTEDGGETWRRLSGGLPTGVVGKIGVTVSPADPDRVWALVAEEAADRGGLYRSDDAGRRWRRVNDERELRQRAYYYTHVRADPRDRNTVYALNVGLHRSTDGGRTFERVRVPHGDTHDLWINPEQPELMALADDGGAQVTTNGGRSWSTMRNQPTAQFYRLSLDTASFPFRLCGGQQDNSAICVSAWRQQAPTRFTFWHATGGCESGDVAVDPRDPSRIYGGCYSGDLYAWDEGTRQGRNVVPYPQMQDGQAIRDLKYRFNWNPPLQISPHDPASAYVAAYNYRLDDFSPYAWRTDDYGETWTRIADGSGGIPSDHPTRVVREDPHREGLLYAGTEFGLFVSFDDGASWRPFRLAGGGDRAGGGERDGALPVTPVTDLKLHRRNLAVATQGRSFWILDDLSPLHQWDRAVASSELHLFAPRDAYRTSRRGYRDPAAPESRPDGAILYYWVGERPRGTVTLAVMDGRGDTVARYSSDSAEAADPGVDPLPVDPGTHRLVWDLKGRAPDLVEDAVVFYGYAGAPRVVPGRFRVRMEAGEWSQTRELRVREDPRLEAVSREDLVAQHELMSKIRDRLDEIHGAIRRIRVVRAQARGAAERLRAGGQPDGAARRAAGLADSVVQRLTGVETELLQTKAESGQDPINYESRLSGYFAHLALSVRSADARPTDGARRRYGDLVEELREQEERLRQVLEESVPRLNRALREAGYAPVGEAKRRGSDR